MYIQVSLIIEDSYLNNYPLSTLIEYHKKVCPGLHRYCDIHKANWKENRTISNS